MMLTDEKLTEIWRRRQAINADGWTIEDSHSPYVWDGRGNIVARVHTMEYAEFVQNAPADIEALLIEVKRLRQLVTDHIAQPKPVSQTGLEWGEARAKQLRDLVDEIAREYKTPQHDRESTEPPPVIEDQLDSGESE